MSDLYQFICIDNSPPGQTPEGAGLFLMISKRQAKNPKVCANVQSYDAGTYFRNRSASVAPPVAPLCVALARTLDARFAAPG
jgi:hypothetical protein